MTIVGSAETKVASFVNEFNAAYTTWSNAVQAQSRQSPAAQAATEDVLHRWRQYNEVLKDLTVLGMNDTSTMSGLAQSVAQVTEERSILSKLRGEVVTRTDQADSLDARISNSPYTNILGLQRTFRPATWNALLAAAILFGTLTLVLVGLLIWAVIHNKMTLVNYSIPRPVGVGVGGGGGRGRG